MSGDTRRVVDFGGRPAGKPYKVDFVNRWPRVWSWGHGYGRFGVERRPPP